MLHQREENVKQEKGAIACDTGLNPGQGPQMLKWLSKIWIYALAHLKQNRDVRTAVGNCGGRRELLREVDML